MNDTAIVHALKLNFAKSHVYQHSFGLVRGHIYINTASA